MLAVLARTKTTTTDDPSPLATDDQHAGLPERYDTQGDKPTASVCVLARLLDSGGNEVAGATCSVRMWMRVTLRGTSTSFWMDCGKRTYVGSRALAFFSFPPLNAGTGIRLQVTDVSGTGITKIDLYAMPGGDLAGAYDPSTGALRTGDVFQRGGEQNALGLHMVARRAHQSADGAPSWDDSAAAETSSITKAGPGNLFGFIMTNANAAARYLQFFDSVTVPADTAVPKLSILIPATSTLIANVPFERRFFATGIAWALSTTGPTKTLAGADAFGHVAYT